MITEDEYKKAKAIVIAYEAEEMDKHRFCKGCEAEVSKTMICQCSGQPLQESQVYTAQQLMEKEDYEIRHCDNCGNDYEKQDGAPFVCPNCFGEPYKPPLLRDDNFSGHDDADRPFGVHP